MLTAEHKRALRILAGCPEGATEHAMATLNGVTRGILDDLVCAGLVRCQLQQLAKLRMLAIPRFWITEAGKKAL